METQKKRNGRSSIAGTIIAAICIIIYLGALVQAAVRIYFSIEERRITAEKEFEEIADVVVFLGNIKFMDDQFKEAVNVKLASSKSLEALIISGPDGEYVFERQRGYAVTWVNNMPRFIDRFGLSGQSFYKPLPILNLRNANIQAAAGTFDNAEFSVILKETLLLILAGFTLAFFTIIIQLMFGKSTERIPVVTYDQHNRSQEFSKESTESGPKGLFSPRSNIGWEEYTKDRLNSELHRCSSTEDDLTLFIVEFTFPMNDTMFKETVEEAVSLFTSRDLLFENGSQGITVIYPGINLETGIAKAQKYYNRINDKFMTRQNRTSLFIGLTSRSGRLLNAERMIMEASEALHKAKTGRKSSIIAFKSDPEKYRKFIASQNQTRS
jgi:GGDEF domain-containing protein